MNELKLSVRAGLVRWQPILAKGWVSITYPFWMWSEACKITNTNAADRAAAYAADDPIPDPIGISELTYILAVVPYFKLAPRSV